MLDTLKRLLRPAEQKASRAGRLIALESGGRARWTPRDYAALTREGYTRNAIVHRAVRLTAEAVGSVSFVLYEGASELTEHPLLDLTAQPNPRQDGASFLEAIATHLMLSGNAYVEAVSVGGAGAPRELYALRPDRVKVVPGPDGWPAAFDYTVSGNTVRFAQEGAVPPILHLTLFNPLDDYYGLSPLEAAATAVDTHNAATLWNKALLDNAARPSGALLYAGADGSILNETQFERLKKELDGQYQGAANAGRPLLLEGGLDWKPMSLTPKDMDFLEAKHAAAREIALAFGVPPMLLAIPGDNTYSNYQEANRVFWRQSVLPLANRIAAALSLWLAPGFGQAALTLAVDADRIEALSADRAALWERVSKAPFLTVNEKRAAAGYGAVAGGDVV
ncbi:phage portal protein [Undibacter mobilis]|uniref:Phage portal protein n=1 Tax=Undibacter mobilis TaxID=2292256 RepID=A0A371B3K3_9BRAD|nr:phage portal protein [Undibacter mobilis]RDV02159.1 phage portal protein [Undibacter mobilis]